MFVLPCADLTKALEVTRQRLLGRGTETEDQILKRIKTAEKELDMLSKVKFFKYKFINDDLDKSTKEF